MKRLTSIWLIVSFFATSIMAPQQSYAQEQLNLPAPGSMVNLSTAYLPLLIKGLKVHPENPLLFDFILDTGNSGLKVNSPEFKIESQNLIKYFLASLTIKEDDLWVNLSPYEKDRMIPRELGQTELGRDMLEQDYILKQLTASLVYPEKHLGKEFWNRVYAKAQQMYGSSEVPVNTFNKVWIVADKAKVLERNNAAYVIGAHLKVMLEEDYLALEKHTNNNSLPLAGRVREGGTNVNTIGSQIVRQIILPELEKDVNQGKNFAPLRQMFYSMVLASWYKLALKDALLNQVYSNKGKTGGALFNDPGIKENIYEQYLKAYKKGVFNYIKEDMDAVSKQPIPRKYFSGGLKLWNLKPEDIIERESELSPGENSAMAVAGDMALVTANIDKAMSLPPIMDFLITEKCNRDCSVCWGSYFPPHRDGTLEEHKKIVDIMQANGVSTLTITGGEPLVVPHIVELVKYAKAKGLRVLFFTNSTVLKDRKFFDLIPNIDRLSISINGYTMEHDKVSGREGMGTFKEALRTIELLKKHFPNLDVQVLTVASARNIEDLPKIGELMDQQRQGLKNFRWKISRYKRIGRSAFLFSEDMDPFTIDYGSYAKAAKAMQERFRNRFTVAYDPPEYDNSYLFVLPDGQLAASNNRKYTIYGNILDPDTLEKFQTSGSLAEVTGKMTSKMQHLGRSDFLVKKPGEPEGAQAAMLGTPAWPQNTPEITTPEVERAIKQIFPVMSFILTRLNYDIGTAGMTSRNVLHILLQSLRPLTNQNDVLFEAAVKDAKSTLGEPTNGSSAQEWVIFIQRVLFNLNISLFVKQGWLIDIGYDEHKFLRARRERVKYYEIIQDEDQPVLLVQVEPDDKSIPGMRILYDSYGSYIAPGTVILGELTDEQLDAEYDRYLAFAQNESNRSTSPSVTQIVGYLSAVSKEDFRKIYREQLLNEEWGHYKEFREREKLQQGAANLINAQQIERHVDIAFPASSDHPAVKMIRGIFNIYLAFHKKQEHPVAGEMINIVTETNARVQRLYFSPSYEHFIVALSAITDDIFSEDDVQRESARMAIYSLEKILKGESGPGSDEELDNFSRDLHTFYALPEIAKLDPHELYKKVKELGNEAMIGQSWENFFRNEPFMQRLTTVSDGTRITRGKFFQNLIDDKEYGGLIPDREIDTFRKETGKLDRDQFDIRLRQSFAKSSVYFLGSTQLMAELMKDDLIWIYMRSVAGILQKYKGIPLKRIRGNDIKTYREQFLCFMYVLEQWDLIQAQKLKNNAQPTENAARINAAMSSVVRDLISDLGEFIKNPRDKRFEMYVTDLSLSATLPTFSDNGNEQHLQELLERYAPLGLHKDFIGSGFSFIIPVKKPQSREETVTEAQSTAQKLRDKLSQEMSKIIDLSSQFMAPMSANDRAMSGLDNPEGGDFSDTLIADRKVVHDALYEITFGSRHVEVSMEDVHEIARKLQLPEKEIITIMEHSFGMRNEGNGKWNSFNTEIEPSDPIDYAMKANAAPGGIDLNAKNMNLNITKDGEGVEMKLNPSMVAEFQHGNFFGIVPVIIRIRSIASPLPLFGIGPAKKIE